MNKLYLAGPMSGLQGMNYEAFNKEAARLRAMGFDVLNPAENPEPSCGTWAGYMRLAIAQLVQCDTIRMLEGWELSDGANLEHHIAGRLGLRIVLPHQEVS